MARLARGSSCQSSLSANGGALIVPTVSNFGPQGAGDFLDAYERAILVALEGYAHEDKHFVTIAIGCT